MMHRLLAVLSVALPLAGCADLAAPPPAPVTVLTLVTADPEDARCRAVGTRGRRDAGPAPLSLELAPLGMPVAVTCEREGFQPTTEIIHPRPQPSLLRALNANAAVSPMVDDAPAAGARADTPIPAAVTVRLRPLLFTTPAARDSYYARLREERQARWQALAERVDRECRDGSVSRFGESPLSPPIACRTALEALARQRTADLRALEIDRRRSSFQ